MTAELRCDRCQTAIAAELWNQPAGGACTICGHRLWASVYPAITKSTRGTSAAAVESDAEASCYYHPASRAHLACDTCGRFICALCDLDLGGTHVCPVCLQNTGALPEAGRILDNRRVLYDSIVLALAIVGPFIFLWPSLLTAPLSIVLALWYWNRPRSIVPRTPIRFIIAIALALIQCVFWGFIIWQIATTPRFRA